MFAPQLQETSEINMIKKRLYVLLVVGVVVAVLVFFIKLQMGIMMLLSLAILFCATRCFNYFLIVIFAILTLFGMVTFFMIIGITIQIAVIDTDVKYVYPAIYEYVFLGIKFVYDIVALYMSLIAYRIFKGTLFSSSGEPPSNGHSGPNRQKTRDEGVDMEQKKIKNFEAFKGKGIPIG